MRRSWRLPGRVRLSWSGQTSSPPQPIFASLFLTLFSPQAANSISQLLSNFQVERLDEATRSRSSSPTGQRALSLQSEMEMSGFGLASTSLEMSRTEATVLEMPASVDFERNGFPSRHCDVIPESEEMDTDSSDCEHEVEVEDEEDESAMKEEQLLGELRQEVLSCYSQLRNMGSLLRARERGRAIDGESLDTSSSSGSSSVTSQALRVRQSRF